MLWCNTWEGIGIPGRWVPGQGPLAGAPIRGPTRSESLIGDRTKYGLGHFVLNILERDVLAIKRPGTLSIFESKMSCPEQGTFYQEVTY